MPSERCNTVSAPCSPPSKSCQTFFTKKNGRIWPQLASICANLRFFSSLFLTARLFPKKLCYNTLVQRRGTSPKAPALPRQPMNIKRAVHRRPAGAGKTRAGLSVGPSLHVRLPSQWDCLPECALRLCSPRLRDSALRVFIFPANRKTDRFRSVLDRFSLSPASRLEPAACLPPARAPKG